MHFKRVSGLLMVLVLFTARGAHGAEITFVPESPEFAAAADEYRAIWQADGQRIAEAFRQHTGLSLESGPIRVVVFEGVSYSGDRDKPMQLRASYPLETKRATLVHELSHRLIADLVPEDFEDHPITFLFLYDVWIDLWGKEFADAQVKIERARRGVYDSAWQEVLALTPKERAERWSRFLAERRASQVR